MPVVLQEGPALVARIHVPAVVLGALRASVVPLHLDAVIADVGLDLRVDMVVLVHDPFAAIRLGIVLGRPLAPIDCLVLTGSPLALLGVELP